MENRLSDHRHTQDGIPRVMLTQLTAHMPHPESLLGDNNEQGLRDSSEVFVFVHQIPTERG